MKKFLFFAVVVLSICVIAASGCANKTTSPAPAATKTATKVMTATVTATAATPTQTCTSTDIVPADTATVTQTSTDIVPLDTPTCTETSTVGLDIYEPDDTEADAKPVTLGVTQHHSMNPDGDVDFVSFDVIAGNRYMIRTDDTNNMSVDNYLQFTYDNSDSYYCYQSGFSLPYTYEIFYPDFTGTVVMYINAGYYGNDSEYDLNITQMPAFVTDTLENAVDNPPSLSFTTGGDANWFGQTEVSSVGGSAAQSGHVDNSQSSYMATTVTGPCTVNFKWKVSSEGCCDGLRVDIDGNYYASIQGEIDWADVSMPVTGAGSHTVTWTYYRDGSDNWGSDAGWVDDVVVAP